MDKLRPYLITAFIAFLFGIFVGDILFDKGRFQIQGPYLLDTQTGSVRFVREVVVKKPVTLTPVSKDPFGETPVEPEHSN